MMRRRERKPRATESSEPLDENRAKVATTKKTRNCDVIRNLHPGILVRDSTRLYEFVINIMKPPRFVEHLFDGCGVDVDGEDYRKAT
jgi:hypothetical protein